MTFADTIAAAIAAIDSRAAALSEAREKLVKLLQSVDAGDASAQHVSRKQQVVNAIRANGPLRRRAIARVARIPEGTVSYELNDKKTFARLGDGTWTLTDAARSVMPETEELAMHCCGGAASP